MFLEVEVANIAILNKIQNNVNFLGTKINI